MKDARPDLSSLHIALIGCGKMGGALLRGWLAAGIGRVTVLEPHPLAGELRDARVTHHTNPTGMTGPWDMLVLAVKPQVMAQSCATLSPYLSAATPILSIIAGQSIATIQSYFAQNQPVIRTMPNTPAAIGQGITVAVSSAQIFTNQRTMAQQLLDATGHVAWISDETMMDAVTALSGSGPAYVFFLIEALAAAGVKAGLDAHFAAALARQTVIGSAALAGYDADLSAATLRQNVTSPGGTTEAALAVLMDGRWQDILSDAVAAAARRSKELSK